MTSSGSARRPSRSSRAAATCFASALGLALVAAPLPALAQSRGDNGYDQVVRPGKHRGHRGGGGVGAGIAGALIGIGAGLLIESARARAAEREEIVEERVERPRRRPERAKAEKQKPERPKVVRLTPEENVAPEPKRKPAPKIAEPKKKEPKVARQTPATDKGPKSKAADRNPPPAPPAPPSGAAPVAPALPVIAALSAADQTVVPDEVLFEVRPGTPEQDVDALAGRQGLERLSAETFELTGSTIYRYRITDGRDVPVVVAALAADPMVKDVQPNHIFSLSQASGLAATQYAAAKMRLPEAHRSSTGANVLVAVIDSGIDATHPALKGAVIEAYDPVGGAYKPHSHGTAVAALAVGRGELTSPAPAARILAIRAFAPDQPSRPGAQGTTMHILRGLDFAAKRGARIVNMSFAGPRDAKIAEFVAAGAAKGAIHVAAAGNAGPSSPPLFPAAEPDVIAVTATGPDDRLLDVANRGAHLSVSAPGVDVVVAAPGGGYSYMSGTSMASAEIAGVVALLVDANPLITAREARAALETSARDLGAKGPDPEFGAGAADAKGALDTIAAPGASAFANAPAPAGQAAAAELAERP
jgi:subtilisin family serine protease